MRLEPWRQESESRPPAPQHQLRPLCSHSRRAEALRVRRLKSPSNESGLIKCLLREDSNTPPLDVSLGTVPSSFKAAPLRKQRVRTRGESPQCPGAGGPPRPSHSGLQAKKGQPATLVQVTGIDAQCLFSPSHRLR